MCMYKNDAYELFQIHRFVSNADITGKYMKIQILKTNNIIL